MTAHEILDRIAARMEADILSRKPIITSKCSEIDAAITDIKRRLVEMAAAHTTMARPAVLTRVDPEWERRADALRGFNAQLLELRVRRYINEV